ncbi:MAG TPA: response regulator transcription factor [Vicinamibacterales bacterium]|nr:response regulator transcription factor [Vicinamibacterales bacterium]
MPQPVSRRALVVEDEIAIRELLRLHLGLAGFTLDEAGDGRQALEMARTTSFDLILLDVMLPGLDGVSVCRAIRGGGPNVDSPILMLTARDGEADKVLGLESGADDYLTKPFGIRELMARVGALMRRHVRSTEPTQPSPGPLQSRQLSLDRERREAMVRGEIVELTKQEFDIIYLLASRPGVVFTRAALLQQVWGGDTYVTDRTVDTVISRLRRKIERDPQDPEMLLTAWGVGYKFADAD